MTPLAVTMNVANMSATITRLFLGDPFMNAIVNSVRDSLAIRFDRYFQLLTKSCKWTWSLNLR